MTSSTAGRVRRGAARLAAAALAVAGMTAVGATTAPAQAVDSTVSNATLTWGLSGYAQKGIFGPWTYKNITGNASQLTGSVSGGSQSEYLVDPVPATSMPATTPAGKTPNAIRFTAGKGTADPATNKVSLSWTGSYTVNAYPAMYGAPDEIYSNPKLTLDATGAGSLTMNFALGAGTDMSGNPTPAQDLGRVTLMTYSAGKVASTGTHSFRATPDYQGVAVTVPSGSAQVTNCTTDNGATGWWGSWPQSFVTAVPESVRPHFYSTGCGGMQDNKPPLPIDVTLGAPAVPAVSVSKTTLLPTGTQEVTVTGTGFEPEAAIGTRPPFSGVASGVYVAFGRYAEAWRPSTGAASSTRTNPSGANGTGVAVKWAVPTASFAASSPAQDPSAASYATLDTDGTFSTTIKVDQSWLASASGNFGIYTYAGGGPTVAAYETYTPITFAKATPTVTVTAPAVTYGQAATATVTVANAGSTPSGEVTLKEGTTTLGTATITDGKATFDLGTTLAGGPHALTASYAGDGNHEAATGTGSLTVNATVTVSKTTLLPTGQQAVTVTGAGFTPSLAVGTRPPFAGQQSGAYVAFGRYAEVWRPSAGAPSSSRTNPAGANGTGVAVKWAVPTASFAASNPAQDPSAASYATLDTDGTFTTTIQVDQSWLAAASGNFGIYTYAGGGPTVATYETYTPITFAKATPTVTVTAPAVAFGAPASATVRVTGDGSNTGSVTLKDGSTTIGTQDLVNGEATFDLGDELEAGAHQLSASYAGDANTEAGTATAKLVVGAEVTVSKTTLLPSGQQEVTVTGTGFDPSFATGTRPPFAGQQSGAYIAFGRYADVWRPSAGAPSSSRTNPSGANGTGVAVKWAVPAASFAGSNPAQDPSAASYTVLDADGTFTTKIQVDQSWLAAAAGNFGIYTYAGGGANVAAYETYTPITFAKVAPEVTLEAEDTTYGEAGTATVTVASAGGSTGEVTLSVDGDALAPKSLTDGAATFDLAADLASGEHDLSVAYAGNANTEPGEATATITVAKATPTVTLEADDTVYGDAGTAKVTVESVGGATGDVVLTLDGGEVGTQTLADGSTTFDLPADLAAGVHDLSVAYAGNANTATGEDSLTLTVAAASSEITLTTEDVTYGEAASATVTVTSDGDTAAAATLYDGETEVGTEDVVAGTATFDLGSTLAVGEHALRVVYAGTDSAAGGEATATLVVAKTGASVDVSVPNRTYGQASVATVTVDSPVPGGTVTLKRGSATVGTADVESGRATFSLGKLSAGKHTLTASYSGNDSVDPATGSTTTTVAKASSKVAVKLTTKPTAKKSGRAQATVTTSPAGVAAGTVKLVLRTSGGKLVKQVTVKVNGRGVANATVPKLAKGGYKLVATFVGTSDLVNSSKTLTFQVR